ncbi:MULTISPECIES: spermidine/putrescine ABC transporter substrate-binding protein [unclassified Enterococcus]|uniref:polyamine ABC transporter substrate-binding protein n=1 Tax=unclassified Enterococcus TaxID=2608891 RepID=UPI0015531636|nr:MULTISPECIES: spermidine/putrescine ABC transporter substrate-binding protein [unclassified Enterococcus]MBS7576769.1 spermidine/putrescine ABC transporter substrate-binding protein [Enterococcus sp. MMGLQ5-2]MBS7583744.1 spermidine/putrescine ABC transporter substrate-binding protein [Enterococcus sp. MMGLQ5-1]NPD11605.1 spermidine/putrescine ABC transporter substrate-binding protein [Enterococcus sp. MMGLQ5-1]NPD36606.1 spermidine/putrescine ABC transporter substrate-binding protein [Enter
MKKKLLFAICLIAGIVTISGCSSSNRSEASKETLNVIGWSEYVPEDVISNFESENNVTVNYTTFSDPDEMLAKVQSSAEGTYDMVLAPGMYVQTFKSLDMLEKLDQAALTNIDNLDDASRNQAYDPEGEYSVPYLGTVIAIAANTDLVSEEFTSYSQLLDEKYKDSIVTVEDARAIVGIALMQAGYDINDTSDEGLAAAGKYLASLKPNIKIFDGTSPKTSLINGEVSVGLIYGGEIALAMDADPAIKVYYPKENIYFAYDAFMELKGAKNSKNVEKFINYILEPEVSSEISLQFPYYNPNTKAVDLLPDEYKENKAKMIPEDVFKRSETVLDVGDATEKVDAVWSEFKN